MFSRRQIASSILVLSIACGGDSTGPPGPPTTVSVSAGDQQQGAAGAFLAAPIAAKISDARGRGVPNIAVNFVVLAGGGSIVATSPRTNGAGIISASWRVGTTVGVAQRAVAMALDTLTGALVDSAQFNATVAAGPPAALEVLSGSGQAAGPGEALVDPLRVRVRDAYGNPTPAVVVSWVVTSGTAILGASFTPTDEHGVATNSVTLGLTDTDVEVRVSIASLPAAFFVAIVRRVTTRLATLPGQGFGIARTPGGQLLVTLISNGQVEHIPIANPGSATRTSVGGTPVVIAADAAGALAYAANMSGSLSVIDVASVAKIADVPIPGSAHSLAMSPRGDRVYVTNTGNSVFAVDVATRTVVDTSTVGAGPWGIAFWTTATDSLMYVSAREGGSITEVDMRTGNAVRTFPVGGRPHGLAMAPSGSTLYVADDASGEIRFVNRATGSVGLRLVAPGAFGIAIAPDGNTLFVTTNTGYVVVVDVPTAKITKRYFANGEPRQILALPDGVTAMAANLGGWVDVVTR